MQEIRKNHQKIVRSIQRRERTRPRNEIKRTEFELYNVFYYNGEKDKLDTFAREK